MTHIFYLLLFIPVLAEMIALANPKQCIEQRAKYKAKKYEEYDSADKWHVTSSFIYIILTFVGLFTFQWSLFVLILVLSIVTQKLKKYVVVQFGDALITLSILVFIILNKYHLHIDISNVFLGLFK